MAFNWLKLNDSKTEFIIFDRSDNDNEVKELCIGDCSIEAVTCVKSIGAHLDSKLKMDSQVSAICRSAWFSLYQLGKLRKYLTEEQTKSMVHAHVTSRIDSNNALLLGLPKSKLKRIQLVQNAAARLIKGLE